MDGDWERVKGLFARLVDLDPADRQAALESEAAGDPALRDGVQALLDADDAASQFLEAGADGAPAVTIPEHPWVGRRIGPYRVVREVGRGGTGVVLLARRVEGYMDGEAALKIVPAALVEPHLEARFQQEVRILAGMDHPNVASLLDAGTTPEGLAWFAMDFVDGVSIDAFADEHALDVKARLALFRQVLDGIDHAHGRGVVHRDIKPGNVLVGSDGVPRVVDFGIAHLSEAGPGEPTLVRTRTGQRMLTPEYASPEQVRGEPVGARSDIYSLGVLLYRLLTGRPPYRLDPTRPDAALRAVCETPPHRPSEVVTRPVGSMSATTGAPEADRHLRDAVEVADADDLARRRSSSRDALRRTLQGDLDTMVLHALAKDPAHRYPTAGAFGDDVDRVLAGDPVRARPPGPGRRLASALRRHRRVAVGVGVAALLLTLGGWMGLEARAQREISVAADLELAGLVRSVAETLGRETSTGEPGPTARRVAAVEAAVATLDSLEARADPPGPLLLEALAAALQELGGVQGHPTTANVGRLEDAHRSYQRSLALWEQLANAEPDHPRAPMEVVETRILLADVTLSMGDPAAAHALLDAAEADLDAEATLATDDPVPLSIASMLHERQANRFMAFGDFERAAVYIEALPDLVRRTARASNEGLDRLTALEELPLALSMVSLVRSRLDDLEGSIALAVEATRMADSIADLPGSTQRMVGIRINAWGGLGVRYWEASRAHAADSAFTRAVDGARLLLDSDPGNVAASGLLGSMVAARGGARAAAGRWEGALVDAREGLGLLGPIYPPGPVSDLFLAPVRRGEAEALTGLGRFDEAERAFRTTLGLYDGAGTAAEAPLQQKLRAFAELAYASHLDRRHEVEGTADCARAGELLGLASRRWEALRGQGVLSPGEERIWADRMAARPDPGCPGQ